MLEFVRKAIRGEAGAYIQALVVAVVLAAFIYAVVFGTGCYEPTTPNVNTSPTSNQENTARSDFRVRLQASGREARPGEQATRTLGGTGGTGGSQVSYRWSPPSGATNFAFSPPPEPGGPPYVWLDQAPTDEINITFNQPDLPPGESTMLATDTALAEWDGHSSATSYTTLISNESSTPALSPLTLSAPLLNYAPTSPTETIAMWDVGQWIDFPGVTMTEQLCQDWFGVLQSDVAFLALRAPVSPTAVLTDGYQLPLVSEEPYSNTFDLQEYGAPAPAISVPVELKPERHTFAESKLPSAPGEHWMALGLDPEPVNCTGVELDANSWSFLTGINLDLTHQPNNCEGCQLPFYYCYEGQQPPLSVALFGSELESFQGWGITCIGPYAATLVDQHPWELGGATSVWISSTQAISMSHYVHLSLFSQPMTFTLDFTSTLDTEWSVYGGDWQKPDLNDPITGPFQVTPGQYHRVWLISDPVTPSTDDGAYSLVVTATSALSPTDSLWAADGIWVGDWVAPPGFEPAGDKFYVYLPLVLRSP